MPENDSIGDQNSTSEVSAGIGTAGKIRLFLRKPDDLHELPLEYRWEFTRRHPYYLRFWALARNGSGLQHGELALQQRECARLILIAVNIVAEPPNPMLEYSDLDQVPTAKAFEGGSVAPITFRNCLVTLATGLSADSLMKAALLLAGVAEAKDDEEVRFSLLREIGGGECEEFDRLTNPGGVSIRLKASNRAIIEDLQRYLTDVKQRLNIPESRRRHEKLSEYLRVWDLREGWTKGAYERTQELSFKEIGQHLKKSVETISKQYYSAFQLLTGHKFSPYIWWQLFAPLKLQDLVSTSAECRSRHPMSERTRRPVPESTVASDNDASRLLHGVGTLSTDLEVKDLFLDIADQIQAGVSDDNIAATINLARRDALDLVRYLRERGVSSTSGDFVAD